MVSFSIWGFGWFGGEDTDITGDNSSSLNSVSNDISISGNNSWRINSVSWDVEIWWNNTSSINNVSWDIDIWQKNSGQISTVSGDIDIDESNEWDLKTTSGDISIKNDSSGDISTISWDINVKGKNTGTVTTVSGAIKLDGNGLLIKKFWTFIGWGGNNVISTGGSIIQVNGVTRINWKLMGWDSNSESTGYVMINKIVKIFPGKTKIEINGVEKELTKWNSFSEWDYEFIFTGNDTEIKFTDQKIIINKDSTTMVVYTWN